MCARSRRATYANLGAQVDLRFSVLHWYEMTLSAGYAGSKDKDGSDTKRNGFAVGANYKLSKRTKTYAGLVDVESKDGAGVKDGEYRLFAVGLQHRF